MTHKIRKIFMFFFTIFSFSKFPAVLLTFIISGFLLPHKLFHPKPPENFTPKLSPLPLSFSLYLCYDIDQNNRTLTADSREDRRRRCTGKSTIQPHSHLHIAAQDHNPIQNLPTRR